MYGKVHLEEEIGLLPDEQPPYHHTKQKRIVLFGVPVHFINAAKSPIIACTYAPSQNSEIK